MLVTADHGMSPVDPASTVYVNELWPELAEHLKTGADGKPLAPAGSCRDLFLHARDEHVDEVCAELGERLAGMADVVPSASSSSEGVFASHRLGSAHASRASSSSHATARPSTGTSPAASSSSCTASTAASARRRWRSRSSRGSPEAPGERLGLPHVEWHTLFWHPFAAMGKVDGHKLVLTRGEGSRVWDTDGNEYVDATAGLWFCNVGHERGEIADAVADQLRTLAAHHVFGDHANEPALELARRLAELAPVDDAAVFFGTGGGEAVDTAAKIVRRYWTLQGEPERTVVVWRQLRVPRDERVRHLPLRDPGGARRLRDARRRRRGGGPRRPRGISSARSTSSVAGRRPSSASR